MAELLQSHVRNRVESTGEGGTRPDRCRAATKLPPNHWTNSQHALWAPVRPHVIEFTSGTTALALLLTKAFPFSFLSTPQPNAVHRPVSDRARPAQAVPTPRMSVLLFPEITRQNQRTQQGGRKEWPLGRGTWTYHWKHTATSSLSAGSAYSREGRRARWHRRSYKLRVSMQGTGRSVVWRRWKWAGTSTD